MKKSAYIGFHTIPGFLHPQGAWNIFPIDKGKLLYFR